MSHEDMRQLFEFERFLSGHVIPHVTETRSTTWIFRERH
jgi:hypothetical protein